MVLTLVYVFCTDLTADSEFCFIQHKQNGFFFITEVESVYCAVRTECVLRGAHRFLVYN